LAWNSIFFTYWIFELHGQFSFPTTGNQTKKKANPPAARIAKPTISAILQGRTLRGTIRNAMMPYAISILIFTRFS